MLLDLTLPDLDGLAVCRTLRTRDERLPIIMLTARSEETDIVVGLDAGADDYITKPFRLAELLARVRVRLRLATPRQPPLVQGVLVDPEAHRAWQDSVELDLTPKEFDVLTLLVVDAGRVVARQRLMQEVWDEHYYGSTRTLDMHISVVAQEAGRRPHQPAPHHDRARRRVPLRDRMTCAGACSRRRSRSSSRSSCSSAYRSAIVLDRARARRRAVAAPTRGDARRARARRERSGLGDLTPADARPRSCPPATACMVIYPNGGDLANPTTDLALRRGDRRPGPTRARRACQSPVGPIDARVAARAARARRLLGVAALAAALGLALIQSKRLADPLAAPRPLGDPARRRRLLALDARERRARDRRDRVVASIAARARVEELLRAERSFSQHASHQLRTAAHGLAASHRGARRATTIRRCSEEAEAALEQSARLLSIIEELLALARTGAPAMSRGSISATSCASTSTTSNRCSRAPAGAPRWSRPGRGARDRDARVPWARCSTSCCPTPSGTAQGCVTATVTADERRARVDIADEGAGITDRDDDRVRRAPRRRRATASARRSRRRS